MVFYYFSTHIMFASTSPLSAMEDRSQNKPFSGDKLQCTRLLDSCKLDYIEAAGLFRAFPRLWNFFVKIQS
jgi:hypothetical protein